MKTLPVITCLFVSSLLSHGAPGTRDQQVIADRDNLIEDEHWIYNDFDAAKKSAVSEGKPLLVVFRCIP